MEILYEAEEPIVFTLRTAMGDRLLAYLADATATARWLIMAPCSEQLLTDLKQGRLPLRDALDASWTWLGKLDNDDHWEGAWAVRLEDVSQDHLPAAGAMLLPEHQPVLSTRAVGAMLAPAKTPASVVAYMADAPRKALKVLLEADLDLTGQGRPSDLLRSLYDLPIQRMAYGSFEISFGMPAGLLDEPSLKRSVELLQRGLRWAATEASDDSAPLDAGSDQQRDALLRAVKLLTPPSTGYIERIDVGGRWLQQPVVLTRRSRKRVLAELRQTTTERVGRVEGRLREFDKDNFTFILRETGDGADVPGVFDDSLYDELLDYFTNDDRVIIAGVQRGAKLYVAAVSAADTDANEATDLPQI
ncbi:MAG: hypothetical protein GXP55_22270 [Deltaproteobacteria bacterium]|nr:hypothetical protein [Deltaproteobacteria bacterium]